MINYRLVLGVYYIVDDVNERGVDALICNFGYVDCYSYVLLRWGFSVLVDLCFLFRVGSGNVIMLMDALSHSGL